jgi:hypothetical protein
MLKSKLFTEYIPNNQTMAGETERNAPCMEEKKNAYNDSVENLD